MAPTVCRLKLRPGQPLGLSIYQGPTFLSLPLEIRTKVYEHLLTCLHPIVVYSGSQDHWESEYPELSCLTLGLLHVNKTIAAEAAAFFYHGNSFVFDDNGDRCEYDTWDALYSFLLAIGPVNRGHLTRLEIAVSQPMRVTLGEDGALTTEVPGASWLRKVIPRDQYPRTYPPVRIWRDLTNEYVSPVRIWRDLTNEYVSPAIEAVFRILGPDGSNLLLTALLPVGDIPGIPLHYGEDLEDLEDWDGPWSMEIPEHVENMRRRFTCRSPEDGGRVEVRWKGSLWKTAIKSGIREIEECGWEVLKTDHGSNADWPVVHLTLQKRSAVGNRPTT